MMKTVTGLMFALSLPCVALAEGADVVGVSKVQASDGSWRFRVTVAHGDEGWEHYANSWQVLAPNGQVIATRVLAHPHVEEQPFTRNKSGIVIPEGVDEVIVRAGDSVHGFSGKTMRVKLSD
ncbi:hypothetical protein ACFQ14_16050 [Pseudahrensia aquimaris]|uniref:Uncharacterized protein n=1 Tax=Pseudahrensia aquimaris TaxID=744461 RepID=A0ABW3FHG1_9HYPH